jgi:uncharacterized circularly permuted ATP-grasp superfamily protein
MAGTGAFDEIRGKPGDPAGRPEFARLSEWIETTSPAEFDRRQKAAEAAFRQLGITFAVYGEEERASGSSPSTSCRGSSPRANGQSSAGLVQRVEAINAFLADIYGARASWPISIIPEELILANPQFRADAPAARPPHDIFAHICGIDLVRTGTDEFFVLEDNARTPSGVSYMLENREAMLRLCPELFELSTSRPIDTYPDSLLRDAGLGRRREPGASRSGLRAADPRPFQLGLLRTQLPRRLDGHRAGRGRRSRGRRRRCGCGRSRAACRST